MRTQYSPDQFGFARADGRAVVASFDGSAITSDLGAVVLEHFRPDRKCSNSYFASNFIGLKSLRDF